MLSALLDDPGNGGFAGAGRTPKDKAVIHSTTDHLCQQGITGDQFVLTSQRFQGERAQFLRQGDFAILPLLSFKYIALVSAQRLIFHEAVQFAGIIPLQDTVDAFQFNKQDFLVIGFFGSKSLQKLPGISHGSLFGQFQIDVLRQFFT